MLPQGHFGLILTNEFINIEWNLPGNTGEYSDLQQVLWEGGMTRK
jgi:hypothetical protein